MLPVNLPLILEPAELERYLGAERLLIVDLSKPENYTQQHIPGAVHLDYSRIVAIRPPIMGLVPDDAQLSKVFSAIGMTAQSHVVAYDDEGGTKAARLLWTLDVLGHANHSLLNGGMRAWLAGKHPVNALPPLIKSSDYHAQQSDAAKADKAYILEHLHKPSSVTLLDTRTLAEYRAIDKRAEHAGHIPGAINMDWVLALDSSQRVKAEAELRSMLSKLGVAPDKEIIVYCQTHQRSSHTYVVLKALGYANVKGYPGAWSEWGNSDDTPIE